MLIGNSQSLGGRSRQEDYFATFKFGSYDVVILADGIGGLDNGDLASEVAVKAAKSSILSSTDCAPDTLLHVALSAANRAVAQASPSECVGSMGCTLLMVFFSTTTVQWVSVGDSIFATFSDGVFSQLNDVHNRGSELDALVTTGQISAESAAAHEGRHHITSAVTGLPVQMIDAQSRPRGETARFLVASDGVLELGFNALSVALQRPCSAQSIAESIIQHLSSGDTGDQDNSTVIVVVPDNADTGTEASGTSVQTNKRRVVVAVGLMASALLLGLALVVGNRYDSVIESGDDGASAQVATEHQTKTPVAGCEPLTEGSVAACDTGSDQADVRSVDSAKSGSPETSLAEDVGSEGTATQDKMVSGPEGKPTDPQRDYNERQK